MIDLSNEQYVINSAGGAEFAIALPPSSQLDPTKSYNLQFHFLYQSISPYYAWITCPIVDCLPQRIAAISTALPPLALPISPGTAGISPIRLCIYWRGTKDAGRRLLASHLALRIEPTARHGT